MLPSQAGPFECTEKVFLLSLYKKSYENGKERNRRLAKVYLTKTLPKDLIQYNLVLY
jgi:hypothetical protein